MKLLILTQKVNKHDDVLGFFHRWIEEFASHVESVTVICLEKGEYSLPQNVKVLSLGKESGASKIKYILNFFKLIWQERKNYDTVFVHMNPIYIVLGGILWKMMGKKIALWYTHRQVDLKLRLAAHGADVIFSSAPESFRLKSKKLNIVGHGIDVSKFESKPKSSQTFSIVHVGRITQIKNCEVLIDAVKILKDQGKDVEVKFVGAPVQPGDHAYFETLKKQVKEQNLESHVHFVGSVPNKDIAAYYQNATISVNLTPTGGIDKAVLESFAAGTLALVSNEAFRSFMGDYSEKLVFKYKDAHDLAQKIAALMGSDTSVVSTFFEQKVKTEYSVQSIVGKILAKLS